MESSALHGLVMGWVGNGGAVLVGSCYRRCGLLDGAF